MSDAIENRIVVVVAVSREQMLRNGDLVDCTRAAREIGFRWPVALTREAWDRCVEMSSTVRRVGQDQTGRLWDLLLMLRRAVEQAPLVDGKNFHVWVVQGPEFQSRVRPVAPKAASVELRAVVWAGDDGKPTLIVMLRNEDFA